jgi:hypothetical protein
LEQAVLLAFRLYMFIILFSFQDLWEMYETPSEGEGAGGDGDGQ